MSERKYDEDLGKAVRFTFELEPLKSSITGFGSGRSSLFSLPLTSTHMNLSASAVLYLLPLFQFTIRVQDTQIGPVVAPRPPLLPARASRKCHRLLVLLPRPRTHPAKAVRHRTNRSAQFPFGPVSQSWRSTDFLIFSDFSRQPTNLPGAGLPLRQSAVQRRPPHRQERRTPQPPLPERRHLCRSNFTQQLKRAPPLLHVPPRPTRSERAAPEASADALPLIGHPGLGSTRLLTLTHPHPPPPPPS